MHGVRRELLELQARHIGLPLRSVDLPWPCSNDEYERIMSAACSSAMAEGVEAVAFGDLFLEDIRAYRIRQLKGTELEPVFPVWGIPTQQLAREMVDAGVRAIVTCVDSRQLNPSFAGRVYDHAFLDSLPPGVDPCGENGEFHTFVYASPVFQVGPIPVRVGETVERDGFFFTDVLPG